MEGSYLIQTSNCVFSLCSVLQDAASKKSNNLILDTSDLAISQYSLLVQTPPRSSPGSPAIHARDSISTAPSEEPAPVVAEGGQTVTALLSDPEVSEDAKSDISTTQHSDQSIVSPSPVIVVTQQADEPSTEEASCFEETQEEVQLETDPPPTIADSIDPDAGQEVGTPDASVDPVSSNPILDSPTLSSPQSTDVPAECAQNDKSAAPENGATPDLSTSDQETEGVTDQHICASSSPLPCTDGLVKMSLGSLSEAIGCNSSKPSVMQTVQTTDRAVYLTGGMKDNWEVERVKEEKQRQAVEEEEVDEKIKEEKAETETGEGKEEEIEAERVEGQMGSKAHTGGEPDDDGCPSPECPAESATCLTTEQRETEEKVDDEGKGGELQTKQRKEDEEEAEERDHTEQEEKTEGEGEEVPQSPQPMVLQPESAAELPLDSVALIRELVTEITEVETVISPCTSQSQTP